jgi:hypothetical protein
MRGDCVEGDAVRRVFEEYVQWIPRWVIDSSMSWDYCVVKYAFVPGFHLVEYKRDDEHELYEDVLSTHKTLHEAMGICRVLLANGGVRDQ